MTINNAVGGKTNNNNRLSDNDIIITPAQQQQGTSDNHYYDHATTTRNAAVVVATADVEMTTATTTTTTTNHQSHNDHHHHQQQLPKQSHRFCFVCYCCGKNMRQTVMLVDILGICISIVGIILFVLPSRNDDSTSTTTIGESFLPEFVFEESSEQWKFRVYFTFLLNITFHSLSLRGTYKFFDWMIRVSTAWFLLLLVIPVLLTLSRWNDIKTNSKFLWLILASIVWNGIFVIYPHCVTIREMRLGYYIADDTRSSSTATNPINTW